MLSAKLHCLTWPLHAAAQDIYDAKTAVEHLKGFNVANRYLILLYYNPARMNKKKVSAQSS